MGKGSKFVGGGKQVGQGQAATAVLRAIVQPMGQCRAGGSSGNQSWSCWECTLFWSQQQSGRTHLGVGGLAEGVLLLRLGLLLAAHIK